MYIIRDTYWGGQALRVYSKCIPSGVSRKPGSHASTSGTSRDDEAGSARVCYPRLVKNREWYPRRVVAAVFSLCVSRQDRRLSRTLRTYWQEVTEGCYEVSRGFPSLVMTSNGKARIHGRTLARTAWLKGCQLRADNAPHVSIIEATTTGRKASSTSGVGQPIPIDPGEHWYRRGEVKRFWTATASRENRSPREARAPEQGARGRTISDIRDARIVDIIPDRRHVRY